MITGYPLSFRRATEEQIDRIYEEIAFIAYHFHWSHEEIMNMEHRERQRWVQEISKINQKISGEEQRSILDV